MHDLVSVIVPVFNRSSTIRTALDSILKQTYRDWEVLVVNDGSTDDTASVIETYASKDPRIRILRHGERKGAQAARNTGIRASQGKWVAFLDSDDQWLPDSLQLRLNLAKDKGLFVVHSDCFILRVGCVDPQPFDVPPMQGQIYRELLRRYGPLFPALLVSKDALVQIGYLDEKIVSFQEWDTAIRLAKHYEFGFISKPTFIYNCKNPDTISNNLFRTALGHEQVVSKHWWPILCHVGPWSLGSHYRTAATMYRRTNKKAKAYRCLLIGVVLWPFSPLRVISTRGVSWVKSRVQRILNSRGYMITRTGHTLYYDAKSTVAAARKQGLSVCEYLETSESDQRQRGYRDRVFKNLENLGVFRNCENVCEIGVGTGKHLEKVLQVVKPKSYEVYETARDWVNYLKEEYGNDKSCKVICHDADGTTLKSTRTGSCDLVCAHGVFVYLPILQTLGYIRETVRVCKPGGYVVFDCFLDKSFDLSVAEKWLAGQSRYPAIIPEKLLLDFTGNLSLRLISYFQEVRGPSYGDYLVFQKALEP